MTLNHLFFLAAIETPTLPGPAGAPLTPSTSGLHLQDVLLVVGVILILAFLLFVWVYMTRKKHRPQYTEGGAKVIYKLDKDELEQANRHRKHRKRRPNHPDNLPRNPTLAEAGGLPPIRPDEPSEPVH
jgi:hypothetical protein